MHPIDGTLAHVFLEVLLALASGAASLAQAPSEQVGTPGTPMPTPRSELAAAALRGRIYVAGGIAQLGTTAAFEAYDPAQGSWEELPDLPEAVHHPAAAATGDRVYISGGYTDLGFSAMSRRAFAYDPKATTWAAIADLPAPRAAHARAALAGGLYVVGGVGPGSEDVWVYDPATDRWESLGGRLAAELLIGLGHRRILMINAPRNLNFACERETAFASRATATGASLEVLEADDAIEDEGERLMHEALARGLSATAVFCATDRLAMGALLAARAAGRQVGKELSIVGYDDLPFSRYADPPLTTIRQPIREAGRRLAEILLTRITEPDRPPVAELWQPELVLRASHAPAGHARPGKAA